MEGKERCVLRMAAIDQALLSDETNAVRGCTSACRQNEEQYVSSCSAKGYSNELVVMTPFLHPMMRLESIGS